MPRPYRKHRRYGGGIIRHTLGGRWQAEINRDGRRLRSNWPTLEEARTWIDATTNELDGVPLSTIQLREARLVYSILPEGESLLEIVRAWTAARALPSVTLEDAADQFLEERQAAGRRDLTLKNYTWKFTPLLDQFAGMPISAMTAERLNPMLARWSGTSRDSYRRAWHALFEFAKRRGWVESNPVGSMVRGRADERLPVALSARDARRLLRAAERDAPEIVPGLACALFAGLRPHELLRLDWSAVRPPHIVVTAAASKVRRRRFVRIPDNLSAWLAAYPGSGRIVTSHSTWRRRLAEVRAAARPMVWCSDILRHTFATHHLAAGRDAAATAHEMGSSTDMVFRHYRALATEAEARRFFAIRPAKMSRNVPPVRKPSKISM